MITRSAAKKSSKAGQAPRMDPALVEQMAIVKSILQRNPVDLKQLSNQCLILSKYFLFALIAFSVSVGLPSCMRGSVIWTSQIAKLKIWVAPVISFIHMMLVMTLVVMLDCRILDSLVANNRKPDHRHDILPLVQQVRSLHQASIVRLATSPVSCSFSSFSQKYDLAYKLNFLQAFLGSLGNRSEAFISYSFPSYSWYPEVKNIYLRQVCKYKDKSDVRPALLVLLLSIKVLAYAHNKAVHSLTRSSESSSDRMIYHSSLSDPLLRGFLVKMMVSSDSYTREVFCLAVGVVRFHHYYLIPLHLGE